MSKLISVHELDKKKYKALGLGDEWVPYIGQPETKLRMIVWGDSGQGKTTFVIQLCMELTKIGKVYYNSAEEGEGSSLQNNMRRNDVAGKCKAGAFMIGDRDSFEKMVSRLAQPRHRIKFVVIDSLQYLKLTEDQYKYLIETFPSLGIIMISWADSSGNPKGQHARAIRYMVDIKTYVKKGLATTDSRFGSTIPYRVMEWDEVEKPAPAKLLKASTEQIELAL
ncbi:P-loop NTPase family protein [Hymenobacter rubripertinctus]|uniref:AAA+ ATPase domain-containing protein n=1 Tax=Hymenobacter rubripertinctus TaxID=2029981 RepID=A0A418QN17_9BACT|nr:hypothetical protein [Hymenobacter rubripertinctus]RIY06488.1 hypothetical protein D0T11_18785 [Hymenobacter rubripertinctus]